MWDGELKGMAETYRYVMRLLFANERSVFPSSAGIPETPAFFITAITAAGQPMNESQISKRIVVLGKRLNPEMSGNLRGSRIRKGIITLQRAEESATVTDVNLAKQMSHSVSMAQKYYNIWEQADSDIQVASYLRLLTSAEAPKEKQQEKKGDDESLLFDPADVKIRFVPDPVVEDQQQERPHHIEMRFVPDTGVTTNLGACEANPTDGHEKDHVDLNQEEKRELLKLFQDLLRFGRVPPKQIFNQRKIGNNTLRTVRYEKAVGYMQHKSQINLTSADKCKSWLETGEIHNLAASTTSSLGARRYWTELQSELVKEATLHLPYSAKASDIFVAVCDDEACQDHHLTELFTRQQIRDKFKNLAKRRQ